MNGYDHISLLQRRFEPRDLAGLRLGARLRLRKLRLEIFDPEPLGVVPRGGNRSPRGTHSTDGSAEGARRHFGHENRSDGPAARVVLPPA